MNRYFSSFVITLFIYSLFLLSIFMGVSKEEKKKRPTPTDTYKIHLQKVLEKPKIQKKIIPKQKTVKKERQKDIKKKVKKEVKPKYKFKKTVKKATHKKRKRVRKIEKRKEIIKKTILPKKGKGEEVKKERKPKEVKKLKAPPHKQSTIQKQESKIDQKVKYLQYNYQKILSSIQELQHYPIRARRLHIEGKVEVEFLLKRDGSIKIQEIRCQKRFLKQATRRTIEQASHYFPKPPEDISVHVTLLYKLHD